MDISQIASLFPQIGMLAQQPQMSPMGMMPNQQQLGSSQFFDPSQQAQLQADQIKLQRNMQLANAFMQQGGQYAPNSGKVGILAGLASLIRGKVMEGQNQDALKDVLGRQFQQDNQAAQAKRAQDLEDEQRKMYEKIFENTQSAQGTEKAKKDNALPEVTNGLMIDRNTGQSTAIPGWNDAALSLAQQKAAIEKANRAGPADPYAGIKNAVAQGVITPEEAMKRMHDVALGISDKGANSPAGYRPNAAGTGLEAIPGGPADPATAMNKVQPISAENRTKLGLLDAAQGALDKFTAAGTKGGVPTPWANTMTPGNTANTNLDEAIANMLRVESGAAISAGEIQAAKDRYAPGALRSNAENQNRVELLKNKLTQMRQAITTGTNEAAPSGAPAMPQGGHKVGDVLTVNGKQYRVTGGDPADPDLAPL